MDNITIDKYLKGVTEITCVMGQLDLLQAYLSTKHDLFAVKSIESIMNHLSNIVGVDYVPMNIDLSNTMSFKADKNVLNTNYSPDTKTSVNEPYTVCKYSYEDTKKDLFKYNCDDMHIFANSSNLKGMKYNKDNKTLTIQFQNNRVYEYQNVSEYACQLLLDCEKNGNSVGQFFNKNISRKYNYKELTK